MTGMRLPRIIQTLRQSENSSQGPIHFAGKKEKGHSFMKREFWPKKGWRTSLERQVIYFCGQAGKDLAQQRGGSNETDIPSPVCFRRFR
jgi:hypothetical protein